MKNYTYTFIKNKTTGEKLTLYSIIEKAELPHFKVVCKDIYHLPYYIFDEAYDIYGNKMDDAYAVYLRSEDHKKYFFDMIDSSYEIKRRYKEYLRKKGYDVDGYYTPDFYLGCEKHLKLKKRNPFYKLTGI